MGKAGGIIGIIAGVFGVGAALVTLLFGGVGAAFDANGAQTVVGLGWGGIAFSFLAIVFGAVAFAKPRGAGIGLVIVSILGAILGGTLVAIFMVLALIGGVFAIFGSRSAPQPVAKPADVASASKSVKVVVLVVIAASGIAVAIVSAIKGANRGPDALRTNAAKHPATPPIAQDTFQMQGDRTNVVSAKPATAIGTPPTSQSLSEAVTQPHVPGEIKTVSTRFGDLSISPDNELLYQGRLLTPIVQGNNNLDIVRTFRLGAVDAALLQDTGGAACPAQFYIVTTSPAGATVTQGFGSCSDSIELTQDGEAISLSMTGFAGPAEPEAKQRSAVVEKHVFRFKGAVLTENGAPLQ